jgi:hypothetical protein
MERSEAQCNESDLTVLLSGLSKSEIFELGWDLHSCLSGHTFDARDLARAMCANPIFEKYLDGLGENIFENPVEAIGPVKRALMADLDR